MMTRKQGMPVSTLARWFKKRLLFPSRYGSVFRQRGALFESLEERLVLSAAFDVTGLTALRNDPVYSSIDGSGVGIAILDSGVYAQNPDLKSNVVAYYNAVEGAVPASIDASSVSSATDQEGHGTHVSGIAASSNPDIGVAYKAHLIDVKVIPDSGESQIGGDPLLRGLQFVGQFADQFNIKVVNMSLGEADQSGGLNLNTVPNADDISREIQDLESLGITVVSAAGNSYANDPVPGESYPAVVSTISVASTWADSGSGYDFNVVAWGSNYDSYAAFEQSAAADRFSATSQRSTLSNQVAAPGVDIYSTWNDSSSGSGGGNLLYNTLSGTSMASPFVAGVVALMQDAAYTFGGQYLTDTTQIRQIIQQTADVIVDSNVSDNGRVPLVN
ncbi:MAG: S8 family serine peptidase, partial [Tepidisphaeraceae bacterium]